MLLELSRRLLENYALCDSCLGRQFAMLLHGPTNEERGRAIKLLLAAEAVNQALEGDRKVGVAMLRSLASNGMMPEASETLRRMGRRAKVEGKRCYICNGASARLGEVSAKAVEALQDLTFRSFLVGVKVPTEVEEREDELRSWGKARYGESIRGELSRRVGKMVGNLLGKEVDHRRPDILILVNPLTMEVSLSLNPFYIAGRFMKLERGLPQASRPCRSCRGSGCEECGFTGRRKEDSIESLVSEEVLAATGGEGAKLHTAVRDRAETLVLGSGRPFVLEVKRPRHRLLDLKALEEKVNSSTGTRVRLRGLRLSSKEEASKVRRSDRMEETYRALIEIDQDIDEASLASLREALERVEVKQFTVRGKPLGRPRVIQWLGYELMGPRRMELRVKCTGGLRMDSFIVGGEPRTEPNIPETLNRKVDCLELDAIEVDMEEF